MALTILSTPPDYSSVHGDLIYTVSETVHTADPATYPNYKFIADVYVGGVLIARVKKEPNPTTLLGIFNLGQVVRNYMATTFNPAAGLVTQQMGDTEFSLSVQVKFGEEYSFTEYLNVTNDSTRTFFNNYNPRFAGATAELASYTNKAATTRPSITSVDEDSEHQFLSYMTTSSGNVPYSLKSYNSNGTVIQTVTGNASATNNKSMLVFNVAPIALETFSPGFTTGAIYYTVQLNSGSIYRFNLTCEAIYTNYTLHFLTRFSGWESKDFSKVSRNPISIERKDFGKLPYTVDGSGVVSYKNSNNVFNESRSVYSSQFKEKMVLNSDLLGDEEYTWLEQLVVSPMVYIEQDGNFYPCVITDTNYEPKKVVNDELTNLTLTIEFGEQRNAQYR